MSIATELDIKKGVKLADHCRFGVGGPADFFVEVTTAEEVKEAIVYALECNIKFFVYGGGSNLFFNDKGFRGLVIRISGGRFEVGSKGVVRVDAGYLLPKLVRDLAKQGWGGLEFLGNIPGSVGGAVVGNAGCYGRAIKDVLTLARVYSVKDNKIIKVAPDFFNFSYRHSDLKYSSDYIVVEATLKLVNRPKQKILSEVETELKERKTKHPHTAKCAGSFFKNPEGMSAWKIITDVGMNSASVGDAVISPKHANFLVNNGSTTSKDILELARQIKTEIKSKLGIELESEARYVGQHGVEPIL